MRRNYGISITIESWPKDVDERQRNKTCKFTTVAATWNGFGGIVNTRAAALEIYNAANEAAQAASGQVFPRRAGFPKRGR